MFIGHYAVGFAAKKWAPKTSLGILFAAAIWLDIVWPFFLRFGWEHFNIAPGITKMSPFDFTDYPLSHSLAMAIVWGAGFGLLYLIFGKNSKTALILGGLVVSHWILDFIVHRPDLPLLPAEVVAYGQVNKYGLSLWNHPWIEVPLEVGLFAAGVWLYAASTRSKDSAGNWGLLAFVLFLLVFFTWSLNGIPPSDPNIVSAMGQSQLLLLLWGYWFDGHRKAA